jgi:hypothetical protein
MRPSRRPAGAHALRALLCVAICPLAVSSCGTGDLLGAMPALDGGLGGGGGAPGSGGGAPATGGGSGGSAGKGEGGSGGAKADAGTDVSPGSLPDTMIAADTMTAGCPAAGAIDLSWLAAYQTDVLARLTGKTPYAPGKSLANRGNIDNRKIAAQLLAQMLTDLQLTPQMHLYGTGANVFAVLPSTTGNPERIVVGGHYDTVTNTPGASDNASGVAAVLATARAMTQVTCRARTLIFVLFDQEEVGLVGSEAYADKLAADAIPVHSVHSIDQLGWDEDQDHLIELERGDADIRQLYQNAVTALGIDVPLSATRTGSTDHESFRPRFKAIGVTEEYAGGDTSPHRHRITDTYETIDLNYLQTGTRVVIRVMSDLMGTMP